MTQQKILCSCGNSLEVASEICSGHQFWGVAISNHPAGGLPWRYFPAVPSSPVKAYMRKLAVEARNIYLESGNWQYAIDHGVFFELEWIIQDDDEMEAMMVRVYDTSISAILHTIEDPSDL